MVQSFNNTITFVIMGRSIRIIEVDKAIKQSKDERFPTSIQFGMIQNVTPN